MQMFNDWCHPTKVWQFQLLSYILPTVPVSTDLYALYCRNYSEMVNWILVELEKDMFLDFGYSVFTYFFFLLKNRYYLFLKYGWFLQIFCTQLYANFTYSIIYLDGQIIKSLLVLWYFKKIHLSRWKAVVLIMKFIV